MKKETAGSVKSLEGTDICWVEEAQYLSRESLDILLPTIRKAGAEHIWTLNPTERTDPVYTDFVLRERPDAAKALVNLWDNPFASQELLDMARLDSEDEERFAHIWLGECRTSSSQQLIGAKVVTDAIGRGSDVTGPIIFGVDVARFGDDSSVCIARKGGNVLWVKRWRHITPLDIAEQVQQLAAQWSPAAVVVDEVGLGVGTLDPMKRAIGGRCKVIGFNGARKADNDLYANKRAESWGLMKDWLGAGSLLVGEDWEANLAQVRFFYTKGRNAIQLEEKSELKGRSGFSPDLGDALAMTFCHGPIDVSGESFANKSFWA
jgi:phage terminase large subunit